MRIWIPALAVSVLWLLSHTTPWVHESAPSSDSVWRVHSASGQLGWACVELSGPDPGVRFGTSAAEELRTMIAESPDSWWHYTSSREFGTNDLSLGLDRIERRLLQVAWFLPVLLIFLVTILSVRCARRTGPSEQEAEDASSN